MSPSHPGDGTRMRADAVRNHARLLDAAARIVQEQGVSHLTMDAVAAAAGVGKGTLFRRFGDRAGLMGALLEQSEKNFQASCLGESPPVDREAAIARLHAFGVAAIRRCPGEIELRIAAEPHALQRYQSTVRRHYHEQVVAMLHHIAAGGDRDLLSHALLGYLEPALLHHLTQQRGLPLKRLEEGWRALVGLLARSPRSA